MVEQHLADMTDVAALREEVIETARLLATPIDFAGLSKRGILGPLKSGWYELLQADLLPKHVCRQATAIKQVAKRGESKTYLKFRKKHGRAAKLFKGYRGKAFKAQ